MTVADSHHPEVFNSCKIIVDYKGVLIGFLLTWDESLSGFNSISLNWAFNVLIVELSHLNL